MSCKRGATRIDLTLPGSVRAQKLLTRTLTCWWAMTQQTRQLDRSVPTACWWTRWREVTLKRWPSIRMAKYPSRWPPRHSATASWRIARIFADSSSPCRTICHWARSTRATSMSCSIWKSPKSLSTIWIIWKHLPNSFGSSKKSRLRRTRWRMATARSSTRSRTRSRRARLTAVPVRTRACRAPRPAYLIRSQSNVMTPRVPHIFRVRPKKAITKTPKSKLCRSVRLKLKLRIYLILFVVGRWQKRRKDLLKKSKKWSTEFDNNDSELTCTDDTSDSTTSQSNKINFQKSSFNSQLSIRDKSFDKKQTRKLPLLPIGKTDPTCGQK